MKRPKGTVHHASARAHATGLAVGRPPFQRIQIIVNVGRMVQPGERVRYTVEWEATGRDFYTDQDIPPKAVPL